MHLIIYPDSASSATSTLPVWFVLNNVQPAQCGDPIRVLPDIQSIDLTLITCSSSWLRSLFNTLLTLDHEVTCLLESCFITSSLDDFIATFSTATIRTGLNNKFHLRIDTFGRNFWESLHGLKIKWLHVNILNAYCTEHVSVSLSLRSLTQLETLTIRVDSISPNLWEALHSLNIKSVTLGQKGKWSGAIVNNVSRLSLVLQAPKQMETICIDVNAHPDLLDALYGLNIKTLCLCASDENLKVNNVSALYKSLSSLKQLERLDVIVKKYSPGLWKALNGLNIKTLSLRGERDSLSMKHDSAFAQSLESLTQLQTLGIDLYEDCRGLWETLCGLNITCLCLNWRGWIEKVDHVSSLAHSLASLTQLEKLSIKVPSRSRGLWKALRGLNITCLSLGIKESFFLKDNVESMSLSLSSLTQLETLSIKVPEDSTELCQAIHGLNINCLNLSGFSEVFMLFREQFLGKSLSSFSQLEKLTLCVKVYTALPLPKSLKYLNIYCELIVALNFRNFVETLSACTQSLEIKLEIACTSEKMPCLPMQTYTSIHQELENMEHVKVTKFVIYTRKPLILTETDSNLLVQNVVVGVDGNRNDDIGDDELYKRFIDHMDELDRISVRFRIN
ncbi:hypothetical protein DPMN_132259 [Dreissena polymorpha]|uniref:Uncharacterized protein n=1 Tax=Dreissena polymorpha TaxID=45954 RepID=A0A9D4FXZ6_DREPO|nr:hypothetical protein DPMN_132259 [Dreissena polymorpha]